MIEINGNIKYIKISLSGEDYFVLTQMYLPLIGMDSLTVYLTINNMLNSEVTVHKLLDTLSIDNLGILEKSLSKLEGIGLVNEYYSKSKGTLIVINAPLSGKAFLNNTLLQNYLITQIGVVEYQLLREKVFGTKIKGYDDVTKSFDEVFKLANQKNVRIVNNLEEDDNIRIKNSKFDYLFFKMLFDNEILDAVLDDESFQEQILKISYQFQLNEQEMKDAVIKAMVTGKDLKFEDITRNAGYIFQNKVPNGVVSFKDKEVEVYDHRFTSEDLELLQFATSSSIATTLASVSGGKGSLVDVRDFTKLEEVTGLSTGAINILIFYLVNLKEESNLTFSYIEKVARNWMKAGVKTAEDALVMLKKSEDKKTNKKRQVEEPEWMKKEESVVSELTEEEKLQAEELKKKLFGGKK